MGGCGGMKRTFPICSVATAETRTGRRAVDRARAAVDPRGPVTEAPARRAVCCLNANIFFPQLSFASRELARSGPARVVPREVQTWVRSCGASAVVSRAVLRRAAGALASGELPIRWRGFLRTDSAKKPPGRCREPRRNADRANPIHHEIQCRLCTRCAQNCQKISYMVIGDETYQIYGLRS